MSAHLSRALVLAQQHRYEQAIGELTLHLGQHSQDAQAHALLSRCHLALDHYDEAQRHAEETIGLAPDSPIGYEVLAGVLAERNRLTEATQAVDAALRLSPQDPDIYGLKGAIFLRQQKWQAAAEATEQGLMFDPEHVICINVRAQAQVMLGDRAGAAQTVQDALRHNPDDPWIHANQGWASLHANDPRAAAEHFREALRLDPTMEFARAGIVEALKARNFLYRWMLRYFLMMARLPSQARWGIVIGLYLAQRFLSSVAATWPAFAPLALPILGVLIAFAVLSWLSYPLFNLMLRIDRFGRHVLDADERRGANLLGGTLLLAILAVIAFFVTGEGALLWAALVFGLLALPISSIFMLAKGWPRNTMIAATAAILLVSMPLMIPERIWAATGAMGLFQTLSQGAALFPYGIFGSQILANMLMGVKVRK